MISLIVAGLLAVFALTGADYDPAATQVMTARQLYDQAFALIGNGNQSGALETLIVLFKNYPRTSWSIKARSLSRSLEAQINNTYDPSEALAAYAYKEPAQLAPDQSTEAMVDEVLYGEAVAEELGEKPPASMPPPVAVPANPIVPPSKAAVADVDVKSPPKETPKELPKPAPPPVVAAAPVPVPTPAPKEEPRPTPPPVVAAAVPAPTPAPKAEPKPTPPPVVAVAPVPAPAPKEEPRPTPPPVVAAAVPVPTPAPKAEPKPTPPPVVAAAVPVPTPAPKAEPKPTPPPVVAAAPVPTPAPKTEPKPTPAPVVAAPAPTPPLVKPTPAPPKSEPLPAGTQVAAVAPIPVPAIPSDGEPRRTLTNKDIQDVLAAKIVPIRFCFMKGLEENPAIRGQVIVAFTVQPDGSVSDAQVVSSTLNSNVAEDCLERRVMRMRFPPFDGPAVSKKVPFKFTD